ncbi:unnamed protein product [Sympodiomycopsis kandeliae]
MDEAHRRRIQLEYRGRQLDTSSSLGSSSSSTSTRLTRGSIQQLFGPTYPARKHATKVDGSFGAAFGTKQAGNSSKTTSQWILSYEGLAFLFDDDTSRTGPSDVHTDAQPSSLVVFAGNDPLHPDELQWPQQTDIQGEGSTGTSSNAHGLICAKAVMQPERGLELHLLSPPYQSTSTPALLELTLNETAQQDILLDLGPPERKWVKEGTKWSSDHHPATLDYENVLLSSELKSDWVSPEFWSYPSLGIDLLFSSAHQGPLSKIILHSDIPGSATWSRYEFVPWIIKGSSEKAGDSVAVKSKSSRKEKDKSSGSNDSDISPSMQTHSGQADINTNLTTLYSLLGPCPEKEIMTLDRSAETEFRNLLQLNVKTQLRGWKGLVGEVLNLPIGSSNPDGHTNPDGEGEGVVVAWSIVSH